jgi:hypothetical protein
MNRSMAVFSCNQSLINRKIVVSDAEQMRTLFVLASIRQTYRCTVADRFWSTDIRVKSLKN